MRKLNLQPPQIVFDHMTVSEIEDNAGIFIGRNVQFHWSTTLDHSRNGFGAVSGNDNKISGNTHLVLREDHRNDPQKKTE